MQDELNFEGLEKQPLRTFTEKAYLDYSMYVILDRALPALSDGLKPVQRRIIYAMSELGLSAGRSTRKRGTVGDVIGNPRTGTRPLRSSAMAQDSRIVTRSSMARATGVLRRAENPSRPCATQESKLTRYAEVLLANFPTAR